MSLNFQRIVIYFLLGILVWGIAGLVSAFYLTFPNHQDSSIKELDEVIITTEEKVKISASYIKKSPDKVVILLAGKKGNRTSNVSRAQNYIDKGYSVLLPDLRGTGKSEGNIISFGWNERKDLIACFKFLETEGYKNIGAHGSSLGVVNCYWTIYET
jgi:hypothetical protein